MRSVLNRLFRKMRARTPASGGPLALDDPGLVVGLRHVLREAGFDGEGVRAALGAESALLSRLGDLPLHERRLAGLEPLGTLIKLLVLDAPVRTESARAAFGPLPLERAESLGIVAVGSEEVRALVRIVPTTTSSSRQTVARTRRGDSADHVAGVHGPSLTLSSSPSAVVSRRRSTSAPGRVSRHSSRPATASASSRPT